MGRERAWARELSRSVTRPFLHAAELTFDHPETGVRMRFRSELPPDLAAAAEWARQTSGERNPEGLSSPPGAGDTTRPPNQAAPERPAKE